MKKTIFLFLFYLFFVCLVNCVSIPKEAILLSQKIGTDLQKVHQGYRKTIQIHFKTLEDQMNMAIEQVFVPTYLKAKQKSLSRAASDTNENDRDFLVLRWASTTVKTIERKKKEMLRPINELEIEVLDKIDQSFNNLYNANNSITSYLVSIRKVKQTQENFLGMIGLKDIKDDVNSFLIDASKKTDKAIDSLDKL